MPPNQNKRNVQQHFVTASYLAGFTPDGSRDSQLYVYERNTERMFRIAPDEAAKRRNYYSIPTQDGKFNDMVDVRLTALEGQAMPSLRKLLARDFNLSTFERALLAFLIAYQEFRTPWARANFQKIELGLADHTMRVSARTPGYFEQIQKQLQAEGKTDGSVASDEVRDALEKGRIKLVAQPHAGIDSMVSTSEAIGNIYTQMRWTVLYTTEKEFLTSDAPVVRRDAAYKGGLYGGGLTSGTAEVWFPLSRKACLVLTHDAKRMDRFFELLQAGKREEAEALRSELSAIGGFDVDGSLVAAVNSQTIVKADRFVYSPFESDEIPRLFKGESQNIRVSISSPFSRAGKK